MLTIYRRHRKSCPYGSAGRKYRRCRCPIWIGGFLGGVEIRKSLGLRDWEKAQQTVQEWEAEGTPVLEEPAIVTIQQAWSDFLADAAARDLRESTLKKYRVLQKQMEAFARELGLKSIREFDVVLLRKFRESWRDSNISALTKLERLRAFLRFCLDSGWIDYNPAVKLKNPTVRQPPTTPFSREEMIRILAAFDKFTDSYGRTGQATARRLRALVLLLRYSGMRIGDAATCAKERLTGNRLFLYTQKTGVSVNVKLPDLVAKELGKIPTVSAQYFFWTGVSTKEAVAGNWRRRLKKFFQLADVKGAHPHRFRDSFAVELLLTGVPLERVSILLGHSSIKVTEKHYAPWVRARQDQLEADVERSWAQDPIVLAETKGTPEVHGEGDIIN